MQPLWEVLVAGPYNPLYAMGFATAFAIGWSALRREETPDAHALALLVAMAAGGIVGSKLLHFDLHADGYGEKTILGGVLAGIVVFVVARRFLRLGPGAADAVAPAVAVGFAIGRVGCFLSGCCHGIPTSVPWGVRYGPDSAPHAAQLTAGLIPAGAAATLPVHPTQLYEAVLVLMVGAALVRYRGRLRRSGSLALAIGAGYGVLRFGIEFYRAGGSGIAGLKVVQWSVLAAVAILLGVLLWRERRANPGQLAGEMTRPAPDVAVALVLGAVIAAGVLGGGWFTPLERHTLGLLVAPAALLLLTKWLAPAGRRAAPGLAAAVLLVPLVPADSTPGYPRSFFTLGVGASRGDYESVLDLDPADDCSGYDVLLRRYGVGEASGAYTRQMAPRESYSVRVHGFAGRDRVHGSERPLSIRGGAITGAMESQWFGASGGLIGGRWVDHDHLEDQVVPVVGVRLGSAHRLFGEVRYNDPELGGFPRPMLRLGVGYGLSRTGSNVRLGLWDDGAYIGGRLVTAAGLEIEPLLTTAAEGRQQAGLAVRQRFGSGRRLSD